jgi:hypothetical protein
MSLILSDRQASLDQSWGIRNKLGDVQSYKSSVMSDRQTSFDQSRENRNNADVKQISVRHETLGSTPRASDIAHIISVFATLIKTCLSIRHD